MSALILLHPAMTGLEANAWYERHPERRIELRYGKIHLIVYAHPPEVDVLDQVEQQVTEQNR